MILDEPTSALDPVGRHDVREVIAHLRDRGVTVFLNTHLLEEAGQVCDRVAVVDHGRCIAIGALDELLGGVTGVRLAVRGLRQKWWLPLGRFGRWSADGDWLRVGLADANSIPELVAAIVAMGGAVEAVVPERRSLEDRFIELLARS
ncbi:MAG: hypothetical protein ACRDVP_03375 [Acidimicrobiales bacterium]